jgi:hypothetical protein
MPTQRILAALTDTSTSYWLRDALQSSIRRDPADALNDAEALVDLLRNYFTELTAPVE